MQRLGCLGGRQFEGTERKSIHSALDFRLLKVSSESILEAEQKRDLETRRNIGARDPGLSLWSILRTILGECWRQAKQRGELT